MRFKLLHKLLALVLVTGVIPLTVVSVLLIGIGRNQVERTVRQVHRLEADAAASEIRFFMQRAVNVLSGDLEGSIESMSDEDVQAALVWILSKQDNMINIRILRVRDDRGQPVGDAVRLPASSIPQDHQRAYLVRDEDLPDFERHVPVADALATGDTQLSPVYVNQRRGEALVAIALPLTDRARQVRAVVTAEISLREAQRLVSERAIGTSGYAYLVDEESHAIAHPKFDLVSSGATLTGNGIVDQALSSRHADTISFVDDGVDQLGAHAPVYWGGWQIVVQQPSADAFRAVHDMKMRAAFVLVIALVASVVGGALYVRRLVGPLRDVMDGMRRLVDGQLDRKLPVRTRDEVGELAEVFNHMGGMLAESRREIEAWNHELRARVDAKTRALESAQAQLIQSAKLSALGQLGAGVAHELNNPLAGVVGHTTLLRRRLKKLSLPDDERARLEGYLQHVETASVRCREIVHGLLSFSQAAAGGTDTVDVNATTAKLLMLVQSNLRSAGITVRTDLAPDLPHVEANESQLQQVLMHVLTNAQQAMPQGGTVSMETRTHADGVAIKISDTGRGIAAEHLDRIFDPFFTTKDVWQSPGLGLSVCYSIVEAHGGRIEVQSEVSRGSTFTIVLPLRSRTRPGGVAPAAQREPGGLRRGREVGVGA